MSRQLNIRVNTDEFRELERRAASRDAFPGRVATDLINAVLKLDPRLHDAIVDGRVAKALAGEAPAEHEPAEVIDEHLLDAATLSAAEITGQDADSDAVRGLVAGCFRIEGHSVDAIAGALELPNAEIREAEELIGDASSTSDLGRAAEAVLATMRQHADRKS